MKQWEVVEGASWAEGGMLPLPSRLGWRGCLGGELEQRWEMVKTEVESETPGVGGGHGVEGDRVVEFASFSIHLRANDKNMLDRWIRGVESCDKIMSRVKTKVAKE